MFVYTCVNPAGDAGDTSHNILVGGTSTGISSEYYYVLSDIADQYWLPSVRSASSRFHSATRRHQFASVPSRTPPHSVVRPPNLELASTPLNIGHNGSHELQKWNDNKDKKQAISSQHASSLRELTCRMGSHSVTYHPAEVTPLQPVT